MFVRRSLKFAPSPLHSSLPLLVPISARPDALISNCSLSEELIQAVVNSNDPDWGVQTRHSSRQLSEAPLQGLPVEG